MNTLPQYRHDYRPSDFQIPEVTLIFQIFSGYTIVNSRFCTLRTNPEVNSLILDGVDLELVSCRLDGNIINISELTVTNNTLTIPWNGKEYMDIEIENNIYPEKNTHLEGLYYASGFYCTQNEPMGFRHITYFLDRPDVMSIFSVRIEASTQFPILLSNGNKIGSGTLKNDRHFTEWNDPFPKPTYLFALVGADLEEIHDTYTTGSGKTVDLHVFVDHGKGNDALWAMESLKRAMKWDEDRYGREYDLEVFHIVATDSFNMGAMENKSLNIFNTVYIRANSRTSTDKDFIDVEAVIGHEYFHNWTGNRITCRDWFQLTLKEGLTVFRDQNFSADMHSRLTQRISDIEYLREFQFAEDAGNMSHPIQPDSYIEMNNFYTPTVYDKGAEVIRMMETMLGREKFRKGMDCYFARHDGQAVTTTDFVRAISDGSGVNLSDFETSWYHQPRTPILQCTSVYNSEKQTYTITLTQPEIRDPEGHVLAPWYIPCAIALFHPETGALFSLEGASSSIEQPFIDRGIIVCSEQCVSIEFKNISVEPKLSLNRSFSAPIKVESESIDYVFLSLHETDGIARYDAWNRYTIESLRSFIRTGILSEQYIQTFLSILTEVPEDALYHALLLTFPNDSTLLNELAPIHSEFLLAQKKEFLKQIANFPHMRETLRSRYQQALDTYEFTSEVIDDASMKKRAYISSLMALISEFGMSTHQDVETLLKSSKMTLNLVAWKVALEQNPEKGIIVLRDWMVQNGFYDDLLMRMKYFSLVSQISDSSGRFYIEEELERGYFDYTVPNLVRALIGGFTKNIALFHTPDGSGYRFLSEQIQKIDPINPQIASRLSKAFSSYELIDDTMRSRMSDVIRELLKKNLSSGVREILEKVIVQHQ